MYPQEYALLTAHGVDYCAIYGYDKTTLNSSSHQWLSPVKSEREFQEHLLKKIFPDYPNGAFLWQYMNGLLMRASTSVKPKDILV